MAEDMDDEMRAEYDFSDGARNKYAERFAQGVQVKTLDESGNVLEEE